MTRKSIFNFVSRTCPLIWGIVFLLAANAPPTQAQSTITRFTIDGGGGTSQGGSIKIAGTIGQPDAGTLSGGEFQIRGGLWVGSAGPEPATETPTPTETAPTSTTTPTVTPTPSGLDVKPDPLDRFIDARDMAEWVSRVRKLQSNSDVLFELSVFWQGEYPPSNKSDSPSK